MDATLHTITQVEALKRPRGYCAVYVDGDRALQAHRDSVAAAGLRPGDRLDSDALQRKLDAVYEAETFRQALDALAGRDRTVTELRRRLAARQLPQPTIATVLERLRDKGLLDDRRYAREYVKTQGARRGLGPAALRAKLAQLGMASSVVDEALSEELPDGRQESIAQALARQRLARLRSADPRDVRPRLYQFVVRRGFDPDLAARVVDGVLTDDD
ncbi:MAG: regulatory protein RecX [Armatimonadetes bacterium]|nr:regulatory protein RecX [Armatimonadota bacterium]